MALGQTIIDEAEFVAALDKPAEGILRGPKDHESMWHKAQFQEII